MEIRLSESAENSGVVLLECFANGQAPQNVNAGIGFGLYEALSDGDWSLEPGEYGGGSVLRVLVKAPAA